MKKEVFFAVAFLLIGSNVVSASEMDRIIALEEKVANLEARLEILEGSQISESKNNAQNSINNNDSSDTVSDIKCESAGFSYQYLKTELITESTQEYACIYFTYSNNSGGKAYPRFSLPVTVKQNGEILQSYILLSAFSEESQNTDKNIDNGASVDIALYYSLINRDPITVEIQSSSGATIFRKEIPLE